MAASMKDAEAAETAARASDTERAKTPAKAVAGRSRLLPFAVISITYLLFTVTDGALRMIVLLHAYNQSFSAMQVATMFTLYECAGVVTNLAAGFAGARWGIRVTLVTGLCLQLLAYGMLFGWQEEWGQGTAILYVTISQMWGGIAKDLTKLGGKTVTKLVTPEEKTSQLFKLVSLLTGWKNSLKGVGYFLGSALLLWSYEAALANPNPNPNLTPTLTLTLSLTLTATPTLTPTPTPTPTLTLTLTLTLTVTLGRARGDDGSRGRGAPLRHLRAGRLPRLGLGLG